MARRPKTRCCGFTLETGTKIIGFVSLAGYLIQLLVSITQSSALNFQNDSLDPVHAFVSIACAIISSVSIACAVLLLHAVFNNSRSAFLIPWLVVDMILRSIHAVILVSGLCLAISGAVSHGVATVIVMTCGMGMQTYLWYIVLCYFRGLRLHEQTCLAAAAVELDTL